MQYSTISIRLGDLPPAFQRPDPTYAAWQTAQATSLFNYCSAVDSISLMVTFSAAQGGWLDVWGQLFGIPRNSNESDSAYQPRISAWLQAAVGSPYAISSFGSDYFGFPAIVKENLTYGYSITIPSHVTKAQIASFVTALERIRPAGVPITLYQSNQGSYLSTFVYVGGTNTAGPYLGGGTNYVPWPAAANTNNSQPLLPTILITDPVLNGTVTI